jgi:hypothetical protein
MTEAADNLRATAVVQVMDKSLGLGVLDSGWLCDARVKKEVASNRPNMDAKVARHAATPHTIARIVRKHAGVS